MIYIILPNLHFNYKVNACITNLVKTQTDYCKAPMKVLSFSGTPSYCFWSGGINTNIPPLILRQQVQELATKNPVASSLDCSNIYLKDTDFFDSKLNAILEEFQLGSNYIEVSDFALMNYIKEKFPHYKFTFSKNADLKSGFNADILNVLSEQNLFDLIELPVRFNCNEEFLTDLKRKNLYVITTLKPNFCPQYNMCQMAEMECQYNFSSKSQYLQCKKCVEYTDKSFYLNFEEIEKLNKMGFSTFKLANCSSSPTAVYNFLVYFTDTFIKPEHRQETMDIFTRGILL